MKKRLTASMETAVVVGRPCAVAAVGESHIRKAFFSMKRIRWIRVARPPTVVCGHRNMLLFAHSANRCNRNDSAAFPAIWRVWPTIASVTHERRKTLKQTVRLQRVMHAVEAIHQQRIRHRHVHARAAGSRAAARTAEPWRATDAAPASGAKSASSRQR